VSGNKTQALTRAALLLALTLIFQSLRFIIPLPPVLSTFVVGSLVNTCLLVAVEMAGFYPAAVIAVAAPLVAYFQQLLLLPVFIVPVALANLTYLGLFRTGMIWGRWQGIILAAIGKTALLYLTFTWLLSFVAVQPRIAAGLLFVMSWPQLVTAVMGGVLATIITKRLAR